MQHTIFEYETNIQETSKQSLRELGKEEIQTRRQEYIDELWKIQEPSTDVEVTHHAGYNDPNHFRPRRRELVKDGILFECISRPDKHTGITAMTFWFTDKGLEMIR